MDPFDTTTKPAAVEYNIKDALKDFAASTENREFFLRRNSAYKLLDIISFIGLEDSYLVTTDPFGEYVISMMSYRSVVKLICSVPYTSVDMRIFGSSWIVGISSYSADDDDDTNIYTIDNVEIKVVLFGGAASWNVYN